MRLREWDRGVLISFGKLAIINNHRVDTAGDLKLAPERLRHDLAEPG